MTAYESAKASLKTLFDAIPKGKFCQVIVEAQDLEVTFNKMASVLNGIRKYFIDTTGEESPFVKKIDEILPRN